MTIRIKSRAGKTLRTVWLPRRSVNRWHVCRYASGLPRGTYRFCVYAVDCGGNHQKRIGSNRLIVR